MATSRQWRGYRVSSPWSHYSNISSEDSGFGGKSPKSRASPGGCSNPVNRPSPSSFISHIRRRSSLRPVDLTSPSVSRSEKHDDFGSTSKLKLIPDEVATPKFIPLVLRKSFLLSLILAFACLAAALGGIYDYSRKHQGLTTSSRNLIYISRYGPTAILTIIAALWSKIEYRTKQLAPWKEMSKGFAHADKTLLLDYISPINFIAGVSALKDRHFAVAISVLGSLVIRILIIISTGLLVLQNQIIQHKLQPLKVSDKFDASSFNASSVDTRSYLNVYGVAHLNQSFPRGTTHQYAFQSFNTSNQFVTYNSTISATVDVFEADLECETASKSSVDFIPHSSGGFVSAETSSCSISMRAEQLTWGGWVGYMKQASCTNQTGEDSRRFLICTAHISQRSATQTAQGTFQWQQYVTDNTTCLMCIPTYRITSGEIDFTGDLDASPVVELENNSTGRKLKSLSDWDFGSAAFNSMSNTSAVLGSSDAYTDNTGFFQLMNYTSPLLDRPWELLNSTYLLNGSRTAFALLGAQLAKTNLLIPDNSTIPGSYQTWESRLMVQKPAFGGMEALLMLLIIMTVGLLVLHRKSVTPRDIGSMAGLSTILAGSSDIMKLVNGTGHLTTKELEERISSNMYQTSTFCEGETPEFRIITSMAPEMNEPPPDPDIPSETTDNWWRPFGLSVAGRCLIFITPVWLIILLQSMLYLSQTGGISVVPSDQYLHYFWTFLPAIVLQLIAILFDVFHSGIRVLQPYFTLRSGGMPATGSMFDDSNSQLSVQVLWSSAWRKHISLFAATIAVLCAPFLSIVVSGLYQTNNVEQTFPAQAQMNSWFNSSLEVVGYGDASQKKSSVNVNLVPSLLMYGNATCPRWTNPQFAFGQFAIANFTKSETYKTMNESDLPPLISASVPAIRGVLNCTTHDFQLTKWNNSMQPSLNISGEFSNNCIFSDGEISSNQVNLSRNFAKGVSAKWIPLPAGSTECPTSMAVFGDVDDNPTTLVCKPYMERLLVNATFVLPTFELYSHVSPIPQTNTEQVFSNESAWTMTEWTSSGQTWGDIFQYALIPVSVQNTDDRIGELDTFFQALLLSNYMIKTENANTTQLIDRYLGPTKTDSLITGMENLYSLVMAQQFHSRKRLPLAATNSLGLLTSTLPANITTFIQQRLYQDPTSTYILLSLLSTMFICGAIAILTMDTKPVLPKNPCSIGAVAGLLSDADFLALIPPGSEWCSDKELVLRAPFDSYIFSLGWWSRPGGGRRRFGIDVGKADKSG